MSHANRHRIQGVLAMILLAPAIASAQPASHAALPTEIELDKLNLIRRWHTTVPMVRGRETISSIKISEGLLVVGTDQGMVHAYDGETGKALWHVQIGDRSTKTYEPAVTDSFVFAAAGNRLAQVDRQDGRIHWNIELPGPATGGPGANNDYVYVPVSGERIMCFPIKPETGRVFVQHPVKWFYRARDEISNPPIVLEDRVVFVANNGVVYAANLEMRRFFYRFFTFARSSAPLATLDRTLFVASEDFSVYAIDLVRGQMNWRYLSGYPIYAKPIPFVEDVFVMPEGAGLRSISNKTGALNWINEQVNRLVAVSQEHVYGADRNDRMLVLSRKDGAIRGGWDARGFTLSTNNQFTDRIYLATSDGVVVCLHEKQNQTPYEHPQEMGKSEVRRQPEAKGERPSPAKRKGGFFDQDTEKEKTKTKSEPAKGDTKAKSDESKTKRKGFFDD